MKLHCIGQQGELPASVVPDDYLKMIVEATVAHYGRIGFVKPWVSYLAMGEASPIGVCSFKSPPLEDQVEIAYVTLPGHEGRGVATAMAAELVRITNQTDRKLKVTAQTLPEENASTSILRKLGFAQTGSVEHPEDGTVWQWQFSNSMQE